ncbi:hypothetical protein [Nesterenkonia populi]
MLAFGRHASDSAIATGARTDQLKDKPWGHQSLTESHASATTPFHHQRHLPLHQPRTVQPALAQFNTQPVESYRQFVTEYRDLADTLHDRVMQGEDVRVNFPLVFDISESVRKDFEDAFIRFQQQ